MRIFSRGSILGAGCNGYRPIQPSGAQLQAEDMACTDLPDTKVYHLLSGRYTILAVLDWCRHFNFYVATVSAVKLLCATKQLSYSAFCLTETQLVISRMAAITFRGVYTALVTPFTEAGEVDWETYAKLIERQISAGVAGIVPVRMHSMSYSWRAFSCAAFRKLQE